MWLTGVKDDLETFQKIHFGSRDIPTVPDDHSQIPRVNTRHDENREGFTGEDDLGYYPDGVKRTLTDEQIAMFRHSEIYALQRKRQLRNENHEVDDSFNDSPLDLETQHVQREQAAFVSPKQSVNNFMKHYGPGGKNRCDFHIVEETLTNVMDFDRSDQKNGVNITGMRKRSKADNNGRRSDYRDTTSRRQARELDDAVADSGLLDYGEEPSVIQSIEPKLERVKVDYTDHDDMADLQPKEEAVPPKEGRKIWWPTIG